MTMWWRDILIAYMVVASAGSAQAASRGGAFDEVREILAQCQAAYHRLVDYRGTLLREVEQDGFLSGQDVIEVMFRKPAFLYLRWQTGIYKGTELLARPTPTWNRGNLLIKLGEWFDFITASVPPTEAGEPFVPGIKDVNEWLTALVSLARRPPSDPSLRLLEVRTTGPNLAEGRVLLTVPSFLIPFRDNMVAVYEFVIERGTGVPLELVLRGAGGEVRQRLTYTDLQVNVGVPLQAFNWEERTDGVRTVPQAEVDIDLRGFIQNWQRRYGEMTDYTGTWVTEGRGRGRMVRHHAAFKFRKPFDLYLHWGAVDEEGGIQEALFRQGWNDGKVRIHVAFRGIPLIGDVEPDGYWVRRGAYYPLTEFGLNRLVEHLQAQLLRGWLRQELGVRFLGVQEYEGRPCYTLEFVFSDSHQREYTHSRVVTFWDITQRVPVKYEAYDWGGQLDERHEFHQLRFNVSLADADFDAANPAYGFLLFRQAPRLDHFLTGRD